MKDLSKAIQTLPKLLIFKRINNPKTIKHIKNGRFEYQHIYLKGAHK